MLSIPSGNLREILVNPHQEDLGRVTGLLKHFPRDLVDWARAITRCCPHLYDLYIFSSKDASLQHGLQYVAGCS